MKSLIFKIVSVLVPRVRVPTPQVSRQVAGLVEKQKEENLLEKEYIRIRGKQASIFFVTERGGACCNRKKGTHHKINLRHNQRTDTRVRKRESRQDLNQPNHVFDYSLHSLCPCHRSEGSSWKGLQQFVRSLCRCLLPWSVAEDRNHTKSSVIGRYFILIHKVSI